MQRMLLRAGVSVRCVPEARGEHYVPLEGCTIACVLERRYRTSIVQGCVVWASGGAASTWYHWRTRWLGAPTVSAGGGVRAQATAVSGALPLFTIATIRGLLARNQGSRVGCGRVEPRNLSRS